MDLLIFSGDRVRYMHKSEPDEADQRYLADLVKYKLLDKYEGVAQYRDYASTALHLLCMGPD